MRSLTRRFTLTRRIALKLLALGSAAVGVRSSAAMAQETNVTGSSSAKDSGTSVVDWQDTHQRVWLGEQVWANPMEDWKVVDGAAECQTGGGNRNVHLLTHQISQPQLGFSTSIRLQRAKDAKVDKGAGFRLGVRSDIGEYRANCFASNGVIAGIIDGKINLDGASFGGPLDLNNELELKVAATGNDTDGMVQIDVTVNDINGKELASASKAIPAKRLIGNLSFVSNYEARNPRGRAGANQGCCYRFKKWEVGGEGLDAKPEQAFGPILWSMYSLSNSRTDEGYVLKLSALTGPLGQKDNRDVDLQIDRGDGWKTIATEQLDTDAWTAIFRIANWDSTKATPFRLVYKMHHPSGAETVATREGTIQAEPSGRPLRLGALTCQNDYAFPYGPVAENLKRLDPDMLYFSGDQLYEGHGGFGIIRSPAEPAILNYLRKFYQHGWAFGDAMRDRPTLCLPDDHDVFQGNIWGESGKPMNVDDGGASSNGGYIEPARMVNAVHRTNVGHHPDPYDKTPVLQDISVYYGDMVYGGVSFAIIADRQFKSGPEMVDTESGRRDHVPDQDFDTSKLDKPGLVLLGERQEKFLDHWVVDWRGHSMKVVLSQTVFAGVVTHHGKYDGYLKADLDSGGWPQTARNRALRIIRRGKAIHINGDQHLPSLVHYGVDEQRDAGWSFCTPAIAVGYPRWWRPEEMGIPHTNRPEHGLPGTGDYIDGFGNLAHVHAVGYPEVASKKNRYEKAHQKGSGFGMVTIDPVAETYLMEAFKFSVDATDGNADNQFPGWPLTVKKSDNG